MILQTNAGNKQTSHGAKVLNYGEKKEVWFDIRAMSNRLNSPKCKINIASIMIL